MKLFFVLFILFNFLNCAYNTKQPLAVLANENVVGDKAFAKDSWQYFLQHLHIKNGPIKDYAGSVISNQGKHVAIVDYDIGNKDLQQCADVIMRLRAEYLFAQKRFDEIGFHFCSGDYYSWTMYCKGQKPLINGKGVRMTSTQKSFKTTHESLRNYLDIVYAYANTVSLCKELKNADEFKTGTIIITPGNPGHTCIIVDETNDAAGRKLYKLAEGYMPAQSIYILSNPYEAEISPWYHLSKGEIVTASYDFTNYQLKKFE